MEGSKVLSEQEERTGFSSLFRNWMGLLGLIIAAGSLFGFLVMFVLELSSHNNPYTGIITYVLIPGIGAVGFAMVVGGWVLERRAAVREGRPVPKLRIDTDRPHDRKVLVAFLTGGFGVMLVAALGSYGTYHYTESQAFCGQTCHVVMKPEFVAYQNSPHARVGCTECHIGPGAEWYVKAKISGMYQVYSVFFNKFSRPIPTPVHNLRPAQQTCEQCHWPSKFVGNLDRTYRHFLTDGKNSPFSVRLLLRVGGGDPTSGPVGGIHWHMNVSRKTEYIATDDRRQVIPWVRTTDAAGQVTIYKDPSFKDDPSKHTIRRMDCMDCHNRPSHLFKSPNDAVDLSLATYRIDPSLPSIKANAVAVLTGEYKTEDEALRAIESRVRALYPTYPKVDDVIRELQDIYKSNFFPEMKVSWKAYPTDIGHKEWDGCFRCHDNKHVGDSPVRKVISMDCDACHIILAQGSGRQLDELSSTGHRFDHPTGETGKTKCSECHSPSGMDQAGPEPRAGAPTTSH